MKPRWPVLLLLSVMFLLLATATFAQDTTSTHVTIAIAGEGQVFADGVEVGAGTIALPLGETTFSLVPEYSWLVDKVIWRYSADEEWMKVYNVSEVTIDVAPGLDIGVVFEKEEVTCVPGDGSVDDFYVSVSGKGEVRFLDIVATEDNSDEDYDCAPFGAEILFEAIPSTGWQLNKIVWEYDDMEGAPGWYGETTASSIALAYHSEMRLYAYFVQTSADVTVSITGDGNFFADGVKVKPGTTLLPLGETTFTLAPEDGWQVDKILWRYGETQPWTKVYGVSEIKLIVASDLEIGVVFEKTASQSTPTFTPTVTPTQRTIPAKTNTATATATSTLSPPNSTYTSTPTPSPTNTQVDTSTPTPTARPTSESIPTPGSNVISLPMILGAESGGSSVPAPTRE